MENVECLKFKLNEGKCWMFKVLWAHDRMT